jgi:hypothetical protein
MFAQLPIANYGAVYRDYPRQVNQTERAGATQQNLPTVSPNFGPVPFPPKPQVLIPPRLYDFPAQGFQLRPQGTTVPFPLPPQLVIPLRLYNYLEVQPQLATPTAPPPAAIFWVPPQAAQLSPQVWVYWQQNRPVFVIANPAGPVIVLYFRYDP